VHMAADLVIVFLIRIQNQRCWSESLNYSGLHLQFHVEA